MERTPTGKPKYTFWISFGYIIKEEAFHINWFASFIYSECFFLCLYLCLSFCFCLFILRMTLIMMFCDKLSSPTLYYLKVMKVNSFEQCALSLYFYLSYFLSLSLMMMFCDKLSSPTLYLKVNSFEQCALSLSFSYFLSLSLRMAVVMMFCDKLPSPTLYL